MKPLVVMTVFNRMAETRETLRAFEAMTDLNEVEVIIVDNASTDGAGDVAAEWVARHVSKRVQLLQLRENIGCPRALNLALMARKAGQAVVKLDNDVRITTPGWVEDMIWLDGYYRNAAMIGAYYDGVLDGRALECTPHTYKGHKIWRLGHIIGHAVYHSGAFMDAVGYFDVLANDHLYGFEDLLISYKANRLGRDILVWEGWQIENLQRRNSLGDRRNEHVERMRPLYNQRVQALQRTIMTGPDGFPTLSIA